MTIIWVIMQRHTNACMRPIIIFYFPTAAICGYPNRQHGCVINFLPTVHMCKYGPTSQFTHLLSQFLVGRAFFGSCWCRTSIRISDYHSSTSSNIMIVSFSSSRSVCMIEGIWVFPNAWVHNNAWGSNIFHFNYPSYNPASVFFIS